MCVCMCMGQHIGKSNMYYKYIQCMWCITVDKKRSLLLPLVDVGKN